MGATNRASISPNPRGLLLTANTWSGKQTLATNTAICWRDSEIRALSTSDGVLLIEADTTLNLNTTDGDTNIGTAGNTRIGSGSSFVLIDSTGDMTLPGELKHEGSTLSFFNKALVSQAAAYTPTNVSTDRSYDADTVAIAELADVVGTLIADLQTYGLLQ